MGPVHNYILDHWDEIKSGQVVDARVARGERTEHCESESRGIFNFGAGSAI